MMKAPHTAKIKPVEQTLVAPEPIGIDYTLIGPEGKQQLLAERAARLEAEHFQHATNRKIAEQHAKMAANPAVFDQQIEQSKAAMCLIEATLEIVRAELAGLNG